MSLETSFGGTISLDKECYKTKYVKDEGYYKLLERIKIGTKIFI